MRLVFYTYSYTDRLDMPTGLCLERIAWKGYSGIDVSGTHGRSEDPRSFDADRRRLTRDTARRLNLRIEGVITHAELTRTLAGDQPLDLVGSIELAADLGAQGVTFHMGGPQPSIEPAALWKRTVDWIRTAVAAGDAKKIWLAVDGIWPPWIVNSPDSLARLFDEVGADSFGVNFDPCYLTLMGIDPVSFAARFAHRIRHAHLKDHVGRYPKWEHRIPGQGEMDYVAVFRALAAAKFEGSAAVECFIDMPFETACDQGFDAMTRAMTQAGVPPTR